MTEKIFWQDPYLIQVETRITAVQGGDVTVERTIFFANSPAARRATREPSS